MGTFCKQGSKEAENRLNKSPEGGVQLDIFKISGHFIAYKNFLTMSTCPLLNAQHLAYCPLLIVHCCPLLITHCSIFGSFLIAHCPLPIAQYLANDSYLLLARLNPSEMPTATMASWKCDKVLHSGGLQW